MSETGTVLVVDDREAIRFALREHLAARGHEVLEAGTALEAEERATTRSPDVAILDWQLPDAEAPELMARLRRIDPELPIVILTGHGSIDRAVRAIREGADQFLTKPVELAALEVLVSRLMERRRERRTALASARGRDGDPDPFVGTSTAMRRLAEEAQRIAGASSPVLVVGETGTGKGVLARWLHRNGPRSKEAFVDLNCAGLSRELVESELFGHERGAFTGAVTQKQGLLEVAHHGTVFLDEIGELDPAVQPKLLTVLEERRFRRVGDVRERTVDVRLISATHRDVTALVESGRFRADLYFRVSPLKLEVPPLRARTEDIAPIARILLARLAAELGRGRVELGGDAEEALARQPWPGNVRELRNVLERALLFSDRAVLGADSMRFERGASSAPATDSGADETLAALERRHIARVLELEGGVVPRAATRLGIPRSSLYEKMKRLGLKRAR